MTSMAEMRKFQQDYLRAAEELRRLDREMLAGGRGTLHPGKRDRERG